MNRVLKILMILIVICWVFTSQSWRIIIASIWATSEIWKVIVSASKYKAQWWWCEFYSGFPDYDSLFYFYKQILESDAMVMRQWSGRRSKETYTEIKSGRSCKLPLLEQFFMTLVRLHQGYFERDLSDRFSMSQSSVSRITITCYTTAWKAWRGILHSI